MVIEYAGEVIRSALCDKREQYYESKVGWFANNNNNDILHQIRHT